MTKTLIRGGTVVTAVDTYKADVAIVDGRIASIFDPAVSFGAFGSFGGASGAGAAFDVTIDATGKYVMPGGIDAHTHLDMPFGGTSSSDDFRSGTLAAAYGGTTSVMIMWNA